MTNLIIDPPVTAIDPAPRRRRPRITPGRVVAFVILAVFAGSWLLPFLWAVNTAFKSETDAASANPTWIPEQGFTLDAFITTLTAGNVGRWAVNSLVAFTVITLVTLAVSALAAYAFARLEFRGRRILFIVVISAIVVPAQVLIIPLWYEMLALGLVDTFLGLILPQLVAPAMVYILTQFFKQIPVELEEAARMDGASRLRIFWSIVLPLSRPILSAVAIFVFIDSWNNFLWPFLILNDSALLTLPVGLQTVISAYGVQYAQVMAQAVLAALPLIVVFMIFQRQIVKGIATTGLGGQ